MIKAEALNELGQSGPALTILNDLRARNFATPETISATGQDAVRAAILRERLFEFAGEGKRRQDLIRHGRFTEPRQFKEQREPYRILFPIPATQVQTNPLLTQNAGY